MFFQSLIFWLVFSFNLFNLVSFLFFKSSFVYVIFGTAVSLLLPGFSLAVESGGCSLAALRGLLLAVASLAVERGLYCAWGLVVVGPRL